jgi:hypothetical protein
MYFGGYCACSGYYKSMGRLGQALDVEAVVKPRAQGTN